MIENDLITIERVDRTGAEQRRCGCAPDLRQLGCVQPRIVEVGEVMPELRLIAVRVVRAEQQSAGAECVAGAGQGLG